MLHCLCGPPSIPLSFNLAAVLPRRDTECVSSGTARWTPATPRIHRLRRGLPGYLIPFAPHAVAPQRQGQASAPPSPPVFFLISTHFTAPPGIPCTSPALELRRLAALRRVSRRLKTATCATAYTPFTPSNSGQRLPPTSYRGCWHVVCRGFLRRYRPPRRTARSSSRQTELTTEAVFTHAALLHQACAHCGRFPTAASRRSLGRVSVPVWPITLSGRLPIVALGGRYPPN